MSAPSSEDARAAAVAEASEASETEETESDPYVPHRRPSWLSDSHPAFVWGDDETRKKILVDMHKQVSDASAKDAGPDAADKDGDDDDDDDDDDEEDMAYGLDPGFADIDEELRAVEGMITEHTELREVEESDSDSDSDVEESTEHDSASAAPPPADAQSEAQTPTDATVGTAVAAELSAGAAAAVPSASAPADTVSPERRRRAHKGRSGAKAGQQSEASRRRVRVVELPDYLAMLAREHRRQLLEKQRRDLSEASAKAAAAAAAAASDGSPGSGPGSAGGARGPRSELMIRRGYLERLGIAAESAPANTMEMLPPGLRGLDLGINARRAAIASARTRSKPPNMRVPLRDPAGKGKGRGFFRKFAQWIGGSDDAASSSAAAPSSSGASSAAAAAAEQGGRMRTGSSASVTGVGIVFKETADVYLIPARTDFPARVRNAIWHTRAEFMDMVMSNMDEVELEMHQAEEAKRRLQDLRDNPPPGLRKSAAGSSSSSDKSGAEAPSAAAP